MISKKTEKASARVLSALLLASAFMLAAAPSALAAAPAFKLTASSQPTNFVAGAIPGKATLPSLRLPLYSVIATNVGSAPTSGPIIFTDTLPAGLTPISPGARDWNNFRFFEPPGIPCGVTGQTVTCTDSGPKPLQPGQWAQFFVPVEVAADAPASITNQVSVLGGGAAEARTTTTTTVSESLPSFDFLPGPGGLSAVISGPDGQPATQAGSHPYQLTLGFGFPSTELAGGGLISAGHLKEQKARLPRGMVVNPRATPVRCTEAELESNVPAACPAASVVGTVTVTTELEQGPIPVPVALYNMVPPPGAAAELAFNALELGIFIHVLGSVNSAGEYELAADTDNILAREGNPALGVQAQLWGNPSDPSHDAMRGVCAQLSDCEEPVERTDAPLLTMPSSCRPSLSVTGAAADWEEPTIFHSESAQAEDSLGNPTGTDGCNQLDFAPTIEAKPTTNLSDSPTGLDFTLHVPQTDKFESLATANFKDVKVTLPPGMVVNPSSANGLGACSSDQIGLTTPVGQSPIRFSADPATCPDAAKIGKVEVITPALDEPLQGAVYVAKPFDNPFGSLIAIYFAIADPKTGVVSKVATKVEPDPVTGQLRATLSEAPELPIEDVKVSFFNGPRAGLKTPLACGAYATTTNITPWSTPEGANAAPSDSFQTSVAAGGAGPCPTSEALAPHKPAFSAGTISPTAGAYSPFVLKLSREDGSQRLGSLEATLPKGLVGKLAGIPYCSEAQIAAAKSREAPSLGAAEQASPSCPAASEVGTVNVGVGAGIAPYYAQGHAYLAGPYKGAPLSLVIISPAVAGPFDLGVVVARTALYLNSETAQVRAVSDPLPTILQGIPLDIRSIAVKLGRPNFTLNPTSCNPTSVLGSAVSTTGQSAPLTSPFQVGGCSALKFAPKLSLSLKGGTKRTKHPALRAVVTYPKGNYANVAKAQVTLPHSAFLDTTHIGTICTRVQFAADTCPKASVYGFAKATTPLLDKPVEGPIYLRSSSHKLPDLVIALHGQVDADVVGRIDTGKGDGIRTTFEAVPDAPLSKVVLEMKGGKKGLLINSENICSKPQHAIADFTAQNGKVSDTTPLIANSCKKKAKKKHKRH